MAFGDSASSDEQGLALDVETVGEVAMDAIHLLKAAYVRQLAGIGTGRDQCQVNFTGPTITSSGIREVGHMLWRCPRTRVFERIIE